MSPAWTVVFAEAALADLILIEDHLTAAYLGFGDSPGAAARHARTRIEAIIAAAERLASAPFRGAAHDDLLPQLRHLALDNAVYWFLTDRAAQQVKVLAIFFGSQDHQRHMMVRLLQARR
jgi:toxin ParE1/3/4